MDHGNRVKAGAPRGKIAAASSACVLALWAACSPDGGSAPAPPKTTQAPTVGGGGEFRSDYFDQTLTVHPGVFPPDEAEALFLPLLSDHDELLEGARVLDIGAGTGVIGLYALSRGAASSIATDVDERAIQNVIENARRLGFEDRIEARLVPADDMSAYSTIAEDEAST